MTNKDIDNITKEFNDALSVFMKILYMQKDSNMEAVRIGIDIYKYYEQELKKLITLFVSGDKNNTMSMEELYKNIENLRNQINTILKHIMITGLLPTTLNESLKTTIKEEIKKILKEKETIISLTPPKKWWAKKIKDLKKFNPNYNQQQVNATAGKIWYGLPEAKRKEFKEKEGEVLGKAPQNELTK